MARSSSAIAGSIFGAALCVAGATATGQATRNPPSGTPPRSPVQIHNPYDAQFQANQRYLESAPTPSRQPFDPLAGTPDESSAMPGTDQLFSDIQDETLRTRLGWATAQRMGGRRAGIRMVHEPWLAPTGEPLVGVVENRMLTRRQLEHRMALLVGSDLSVGEEMMGANAGRQSEVRKAAADRRALFESEVLAGWIENTAIAVYAERREIGVGEDEIDRMLARLMVGADAPDGAGGKENVLLIGMPEAEMRKELRDALLIDKIVRQAMREVVSENEMREIYIKYPKSFLFAPSRVRAWQLYFPVSGPMSKKDRDRAVDEINRWRKKLARAKTPEDYQELQKELGGAEKLLEHDREAISMQGGGRMPMMRPEKLERPVLIDMGWIAAGDMIPAATHKELFNLKVGETSKVFEPETKDRDLGYNVVKVAERVDGERGGYEEARPHIEDMLFDRVKPLVYEAAKPQMKIYSNSMGLMKSREVAPPPQSYAGATGGVPTQEPDLGALRGEINRPAADNPALYVPPVSDVLMRNADLRARERGE